MWLAEEWFSPDGVPGIAVPFYLAHPRLTRLERKMTGVVEGSNANWQMRILRHEAGHAIVNMIVPGNDPLHKVTIIPRGQSLGATMYLPKQDVHSRQRKEMLDLIRKQDVTLSSSNYGSVFFLTTGFHGLHVTGGLIAFLFVLGRTYASRRFTHRQATTAIVVSYYWHFVDVVWIGLFTMIYLIK